MNKLQQIGTKIGVVSLATVPAFAFADDATGKMVDNAVASLQSLVPAVTAIGAVVITLAVAVVGVMFIKNLVRRSA